MQVQRGIHWKVTADGADAAKGVDLAAAAMSRAGAAADRGREKFQAYGKQGQLTAQQMQALSYQTTDIVTQLAGGQNPLLVLLQQGGQLQNQFGSFEAMFRGIGRAVFSVGGAFVGGAAAIGAVAAAAYKGRQETAELERTLAGAGRITALTADSFEDLARKVERGTRATIGGAREAVQAAAATGQFSQSVIGEAATAIATVAERSGRAAKDVAAEFARSGEGVAKFAAEYNRGTNAITSAQYKRIRALELAGERDKAQLELFRLISAQAGQQMPTDLGILERSLVATKKAASEFIDAMLGLGRPKTPAQEIDELQAKIDGLQLSFWERLKRNLKGEQPLVSLFDLRNAPQKAEALQGALDQQAAVQELQRITRRAAEKRAEDAKKDAAEIAAIEAGRNAALLDLERSRIGQAAAAREVARSKELFDLEQWRRRTLNVEDEYALRRAQIERQGINDRLEALRQEIALESRREVKAGSPQAIQQQARINDLLRQQIALRGQLATIDDGEADFVADQLRREEDVKRENVQRQRERRDRAIAAGQELAEANRALGLEMIRDDRQRALALIAEDVRVWRQRLDLANLGAEARKAAEDNLAQWQMRRQEQLTEQLKPEWQRRLDLYADTTRHMQEAHTAAMNGVTQASEDAWVDLVTKGELNAKRLVQLINEQLARIAWQKYLAKPAANFWETVLGAIFGGGTSGGGNTWGGTDAGFAQPYHTGGVVGQGGTPPRKVSAAAFVGAPRYHLGGIAGGEVAAVLKRGEEVLTADDPRHRNNGGMRSGPMIQQTNIYQVPAGTSPAAYAAALQEHQRRAKAETVAEAMRPGTPLNLAIRGAR